MNFTQCARKRRSKTSMQAYNACIEQILYVDNQIEGYQLFYIRISPQNKDG